MARHVCQRGGIGGQGLNICTAHYDEARDSERGAIGGQGLNITLVTYTCCLNQFLCDDVVT